MIRHMIVEQSVASLLLDETNPRFAEPATSQRDALNRHLADSSSKLLKLAEDIAREGSVNPTDLPVVLAKHGDLVVIEGNRRLAALKLLRHPDLADEESLRQAFRQISRTGVGPDSVVCFLAESREAARHWIELRHTGENQGVGVVEWKPWQSNNFRRRRGSQADRAALFCVAVQHDFPDEADLLHDIESVRRERLTTLGRLIGDPDVRREFGFDFEGDEVVFHFDRGHLLAGMQKIFGDLAGEVGVSKIKSKDQRADYVKDSDDVLPPRAAKLSEPRTAGSTGSGATGGDKRAGTRRSIPREENVIFKGLTLRKVDLRTSRLLKQAQSVDIETASGVVAVMVRVIVELAMTDAIAQQGWPAKESDSLKKKIRVALLALDPECANPRKRDKSLETVWVRSQDDTGMTVQQMHSFVHNIMANPTASEVRELSRTYRVLLERVDQHLVQNAKP
jgi:hypothetical protein